MILAWFRLLMDPITGDGQYRWHAPPQVTLYLYCLHLLHVWHVSIKKSILLYIATTILFSHDTMKSLEVYAFEVLSSNIILPLRWADTIIVAILCPPYMYCIIYNNFRIYLAHNSFNGFWQVVHHIFHVK